MIRDTSRKWIKFLLEKDGGAYFLTEEIEDLAYTIAELEFELKCEAGGKDVCMDEIHMLKASLIRWEDACKTMSILNDKNSDERNHFRYALEDIVSRGCVCKYSSVPDFKCDGCIAKEALKGGCDE